MIALRRWLQRAFDAVDNPAQFVLVAFVGLSLLGSLVLRLPFAYDRGAEPHGWFDTMFWATSASTVTGLSTTDFADFSLFGELVVLALVQVGGFGIVTIGSTLALLTSRRLGLRNRMLAQAEIGAVEMGEMRELIRAIAKITAVTEAVLAAVLFVAFWLRHDLAPGRAAYSAVFHAVTSFNNAGITLESDSLVAFRGDPLVLLPVSVAFVVGGLGFPVLVEFIRRVRPARWSLHTRITLVATGGLLLAGPLVVLVIEWTNPATLGPMAWPDKLLTAWFQGSSPRTAGFHTIPVAEQRSTTLNLDTALMFVGAGPASTSGGIKVTTFAVLAWVMWAEFRGDADVNVFRRRLSSRTIRQALTMALLAVGTVFVSATVLELMSDYDFTRTLFESASAFGTTGMTTGVTAGVPRAGQLLILVMMLVGRVGPMTFVSALALRDSQRAYRFPEERPIIG